MRSLLQRPQHQVSIEELYHRVPGSAVGRRLLHGTLIYGVTNFGLKAVNFGLVVLYTRFLTPADFGAVALAEVIATIMVAVFSLGLSAAFQPLYSSYVGDRTTQHRCISTLLRLGTAATMFSLVLLLLTGTWWAPATGIRVAFFPYIAMALGTTAALQLVDYRLVLYQIEEKPVSYSMLAAACFGFTAAATMYRVVLMRGGAVGLLGGKLTGAVLTLGLAVWLGRHWLNGGWQKSFVREALPLSLPLVPHLLLAFGLVAADRLILQRYRSMEEVGLYSLAYTLGTMMFLVTASVAQAWSPTFYRMANQGDTQRPLLGRMLATILLLLGAVAVLGAAIAHPFIQGVLDPRYWQAARLVPLVIGGYFFHAVFALFQLSALHARKAQLLWVVSIVALTANLALNFAWDRKWGMYGAAWATTVAYALEGLLMYLYAQRVYALPVKGRRLLMVVGIVCALLMITQLSLPAGIQMLATGGAGAVSLALFWLVGRRDLLLLKNLLHPASSS
jgi:O-antigen/teichoic acid export membrane protein